jgi:hypothetical protein
MSGMITPPTISLTAHRYSRTLNAKAAALDGNIWGVKVVGDSCSIGAFLTVKGAALL